MFIVKKSKVSVWNDTKMCSRCPSAEIFQ